MKKRITTIITAMLLPISAQAAEFADVPSTHWAYGIIDELSTKSVINGTGDNKYEPDGTLTRAQFIKLLTCALDDYDGNIQYEPVYADTPVDAWYTPYVNAGVYSSIIEADTGYFYPDNPMTRGEAAVWMVNGTGIQTGSECIFADVTNEEQKNAVAAAVEHGLIQGYEDGTFRPDNFLTRAEAAALVKRTISSKAVTRQVREDAANEVVFKESVKFAASTEEENIITAINSNRKTITISKPDEVIQHLKKGDVLCMPAVEKTGEDILVKATAVNKSGENIIITCTNPELSEVVESIDISAIVSPSSDGAPQLEGSSFGASSAVGGMSFDSSTDAELEGDWHLEDGKVVWEVEAFANGNSKFNLSTPDYEKKKGAYASLDMGLDIFVDIQLSGENTQADFYALTDIHSNIAAVAGYKTSTAVNKEIQLDEIEVKIAGPIKVELTPYITTNAKGEFNVEATATIDSYIGGEFKNGKFSPWNDTDCVATLEADAEGSVEIGPKLVADIAVGGLKVLDIESLDLITLSAELGLGVEGKTAVEQKAGISNDGASYEGHQNTPDENGVIHDCYMCIEGEIYSYDQFSIGLSDDLNDIVKKFADKEIKYESEKNEDRLLPWHYSAGSWGGPEFELKECSHKRVRVSGKVTDKISGEVLPGTSVTVSDQNTIADDNGNYEVFAAPGVQGVAATKPEYRDYWALVTIPEDKGIENNIAMDLKKVKVSGRVYNTKTWESVVGAQITIGDEKTVSDSNGYYSVELEPGDYGVAASFENYYDHWSAVTIGMTDTTVDIGMDENPAGAAMKAYAQFLKDMKNKSNYKFGLIYLNDDDVPELVIYPKMGSRLAQVEIYTYDSTVQQIKWSDSEYASNGYGAYGSCGYKERQGLIYGANGGNRGHWVDYIYSVNGSWATKTADGYWDMSSKYSIDGTTVSESYYNSVFSGFTMIDSSDGYDITGNNIKKILGY